ncbi:MAG: HAMP domain-containing sensor histidine kinase [Parcubacteria group bacterium]|jgi:signal transduction histidine kinase
MFSKFLDGFNFIARCKKYKIGLWQCPNFLFLVMGVVTVTAMVGTYIAARRFDDETVTVVSVSLVVAVIFVIGNLIIRGVERIAEADILKSEFISIISHQLCSPLSAIKWNLEIIETEKTPEHALSDKQMLFLDNIKKSNEQMLKLVSDLLDVVRIDQGRTIFVKEKVDLSRVVREVVEGLKHLTDSKKIKVELGIEDNLPLVVADEKKMRVVFDNLIGNAVKFSNDNSKVLVKLENNTNNVKFTVQDWGVGIPRHQHDKIFEKFFRSSNASRYRTEGVGLGLYLVKAILKSFGGEIWFKSEIDKGSTFFFTLPSVKL